MNYLYLTPIEKISANIAILIIGARPQEHQHTKQIGDRHPTLKLLDTI